MNKTVAFIAVAVIVALAIASTLWIALERPDASATFTGTMVTMIGLATTAGVTFYGLGRVGERLETVEQNTNGRLHQKDAEIADLHRRMLDNGIDPQTGQPVSSGGQTPPTE